MSISVTFFDSPNTPDSLLVEDKVGEGKFDVYKVRSTATQKTYALKIFPNDLKVIPYYIKEKLTASLTHQNIISQVPFVSHRNDFQAILFEFAKNGDFFDIVTNGVIDCEIVARTYFRQLIEGIEYLHSQGYAHLDLKLENLMMGSDFLLKIIDFDQAQRITDKFMSSTGTKRYRAPEVLASDGKDLGAVDIYSAGIILFAFIAKKFPFLEGEDPRKKNLLCYSTYIKEKKAFWRLQNDETGGLFEQDLIEIIDNMVHEDPSKRLKICEIKESNWYKGPVLSIEVLKEQIKKKLVKMDLGKEI